MNVGVDLGKMELLLWKSAMIGLFEVLNNNVQFKDTFSK